jgi:hypothetical protein
MLHSPVKDATAWKGVALRDDDSWIWPLKPEEVRDLTGAMRRLMARGIPWWQLDRENFAMPVLAPRLAELCRELEHGRGFVLVRGFPVNGFTLPEIKAMYYGFSTHMGWMISQNPTGDLIDHVEDKGKSYSSIAVKGYETNARLTPHCDSGDVVGLLCVRKAMTGGGNTIASFTSIYNEILASYPQYLEALYRGFHQNIRGGGPPGPGENVTLHRVPVYFYDGARLSARFNAKAMRTGAEWPGIEPLSQVEKEAIDCVEALALREDLRFDMMLEPGDIQFLCNHSVVHTRSEFIDHEDPERKRLLLRIWINLWEARKFPDNFADHYNTGPRQGVFVRSPELSRGVSESASVGA